MFPYSKWDISKTVTDSEFLSRIQPGLKFNFTYWGDFSDLSFYYFGPNMRFFASNLGHNFSVGPESVFDLRGPNNF